MTAEEDGRKKEKEKGNKGKDKGDWPSPPKQAISSHPIAY
jgi:hypothetical protein